MIAVGATINSHAMGPSVKVLGTGVPSNLANIAALPSDAYFYPSAYGANTATWWTQPAQAMPSLAALSPPAR